MQITVLPFWLCVPWPLTAQDASRKQQAADSTPKQIEAFVPLTLGSLSISVLHTPVIESAGAASGAGKERKNSYQGSAYLHPDERILICESQLHAWHQVPPSFYKLGAGALVAAAGAPLLLKLVLGNKFDVELHR